MQIREKINRLFWIKFFLKKEKFFLVRGGWEIEKCSKEKKGVNTNTNIIMKRSWVPRETVSGAAKN